MQDRSVTAAQIDKIKPIFEHACTLGEAERPSYVHAAAGGDGTLESELQSLLDAHDKSQDFFEKLSTELIGPALSALDLTEKDLVAEGERKILQYEIIERIGVGGMGVVYKARDMRLARTVALKFLPKRDESNPAARARLLAEARAASALDHPNIGVVYDIAEAANGRQFMAMAWYDGETLREKSRRGPVSIDDALAIGVQLSSALAAAHSAGILHRDVKPANVMITRAGGAKLLDFGIAKLMGSEEREMLLTAGTIAYMSPEQTRNEELDARSDIWSVGVLLYEILAAQRPFQGETDDEIVSAIRADEPAPLQLLRPDVPRSISDVVYRCLRKNPQDRYSSSSELLAALSECHTDSGASATPPTDTGKTVPVNGMKQRVVAATAALVVSVVLILWSYSHYISTPRPSANAMADPASIVVLPFRNDVQTADSALSVTRVLAEELRNELSRYGNVIVPGYQSSSMYTDLNSAPQRVRAELGSRYAITGVIAPEGDRVHLRIIDTKSGRELSSRDYPVTQKEVASLVSNATRQIFSELKIATSAPETQRLRNSVTVNPAAYQLYLEGREVELRATPLKVLETPSAESIRRSQAFYARARSLDPSFALAHAKLAMSHINSAAVYDTTRSRLEQARFEAEAALRLDPGLVDAHEALGEYLSRTGNVPAALADLETALKKAPHNVKLLMSLGATYELAGRFEDAVGEFELAQKFDPRNPHTFWEAGGAHGRMRRHDLALRDFGRVIAISPDDYEIRLIKGHSYLRWTGIADTLAAQAAAIPPSWDEGGMATYGRYTALMVQRRYREGLQMLERSRSVLSTDGYVYSPSAMMRGDMLSGLGETQAADTEYAKAVAQLRDSLAVHPGDPAIRAWLGLAYADAGNSSAAIQESEKAMSLAPLATAGPLATAVMGIAVQTFARAGQKDRAFQMIELMLSMPSGREMSVPFLKVWPGFDPLRADPRFKQVVDRFTVK
jgi:eukaryotic-like serine/threonine-protein kinase